MISVWARAHGHEWPAHRRTEIENSRIFQGSSGGVAITATRHAARPDERASSTGLPWLSKCRLLPTLRVWCLNGLVGVVGEDVEWQCNMISISGASQGIMRCHLPC